MSKAFAIVEDAVVLGETTSKGTMTKATERCLHQAMGELGTTDITIESVTTTVSPPAATRPYGEKTVLIYVTMIASKELP